MTLEFTSKVREIPLYPAAATYEFHGELAKLSSNETPWSPHPAVMEAVEAALHTLNRYPDPASTVLRRRIADHYEVPVEGVAVGNGSCDILLTAAEALLEPGAEMVYAWPSFSMYPHVAALAGARAVTVPLDADDRHDLQAMAREVTAATRLLLVCNPNNPTSTAFPVEELDAWVADLPRHVLVVVDEAYVEFSTLNDPADSLALLRHPNVVLLRTFSKIYGLCGLRAGYALGPPEFRRAVDRVRQPFAVNALAQAAAAEVIRHQDEVARRVERTVVERLWLEEELHERGLATADPQANFSWIDLGGRDEVAVLEGLARRGVIVRGGSDLGDPGHMRVSYGTRAENERFVRALDELLRALT